ncbi:MAG: histidinol-phosphate transaminase [Lachnotalea sp.]
MIQHSDHFHGSDLESIETVYGIKKELITSFSANVNPLGVSPLLRKMLADKIDVITSYPDREYTALRQCIATYVGCQSQQIIVGNGSTELISLFIQIKHPTKALIIGPTYSEYEREIALGGGTSLYYPLNEEDDFNINLNDFIPHLHEGIDLLVLCNPNNPTSTSISNNQMRVILDSCKQHDIFVMIDETYIEFADNAEEINSIPLTYYYNNVIILRGISKFFAAPGLRLGYSISGNLDLIKEINKRKNPWTINSLAEVAGTIMFTDTAYISETKKLISSERARIYDILCKAPNLKPYKPSANFILVKIEKENLTSQDIFDSTIRKHLMIRDCSTFPFLSNKFFRFCFMNPSKNDELLTCILEATK